MDVVLEKLDRILMRQEAIAGAMNAFSDILEAVRDQLEELLKWANTPPGTEMQDLIKTLTSGFGDLTEAINALQRQSESLPDRVARAVISARP